MQFIAETSTYYCKSPASKAQQHQFYFKRAGVLL